MSDYRGVRRGTRREMDGRGIVGRRRGPDRLGEGPVVLIVSKLLNTGVTRSGEDSGSMCRLIGALPKGDRDLDVEDQKG